MYVALKHIGGKYTPGEVLPDNLPADKVKWLLEAGAIREIAPATSAPSAPETPNKTNPEETVSETAPQGEMEPDDEVDEEAEAPEIDITEGLVSGGVDTSKPDNKKTAKRGKAK